MSDWLRNQPDEYFLAGATAHILTKIVCFPLKQTIILYSFCCFFVSRCQQIKVEVVISEPFGDFRPISRQDRKVHLSRMIAVGMLMHARCFALTRVVFNYKKQSLGLACFFWGGHKHLYKILYLQYCMCLHCFFRISQVSLPACIYTISCHPFWPSILHRF